MTITIATNAGDPPPRVRLWANVDQYVEQLELAEAATRRYFLNDAVESTDDDRA